MSGDHYCTLDKEEPHWTCKTGRKSGHTYHSSRENCQKECGGRITLVSSLIAILTGVAIGAFGVLFSVRSYGFQNNENNEDSGKELSELWAVWDKITKLGIFSGAGHLRFISAINARKNTENIVKYINFLIETNPSVKSNIETHEIMDLTPHGIVGWANRKIDEIEKIEKIRRNQSVPTMLRSGRPVGTVENGNISPQIFAFKSKRKSIIKKSKRKTKKSRNSKKSKRKTKKSKRKTKKSSKKSRKVRKSH